MRCELAQAVTGAVLAVLDTDKLVAPEEEEDEVGAAVLVMVPA